MTTRFPLASFNERTLNRIATMAAGQEVRVALSTRIGPPAVVVAESRTAYLDPARAGLFDLFLAARLVLRRRSVSEFRDESGVPEARVREWVRKDRDQLAHDFPRILQVLDGYYHPGRSDEGVDDGGEDAPQIVWDSVEFRALGREDLPEQDGRGSFQHAPGIDVTGTEDDFAWLIEAIEAGRYSLEDSIDLEGLRVATCPLKLSFSQAFGPEFEQLEATIAQYKDAAKSLMQCYRRRSEGLVEATASTRRMTSGVRLDPGRLIDARIARRTGRTAKLFRMPTQRASSMFDPSKHLVVMAVDLNSLRPGPIGNPGFSKNALAVSVRVYEALGVDLTIVGFWDRVVELSDGRRVYLHIPVPIKEPHQRYDGAFWSRLAFVMNHRPNLPGAEAGCHAFQLRAVERAIDRASDEVAYHHRMVLMIALRGMVDAGPEFDTEEAWARAARRLDAQLETMVRRHDGNWGDPSFFFVPRSLIDNAQPGGWVSRMSSF